MGEYNLRVWMDQPLLFVGVVKPAEQIIDDIQPRQTLVVGALQILWRHACAAMVAAVIMR